LITYINSPFFFKNFCLLILLSLSCQKTQTLKNTIIKLQNDAGVEVIISQAKITNALKFKFEAIDQKETLHFYDTNLPINGLMGIGRPTLVELDKNSAFKQKRKAYALEKLVQNKDDMKTYPPGPIHLILELEKKSFLKKKYFSIPLLITYMACTETYCHPPVTRKRVSVNIPADWLQD
jgi:hypothetical protein